MLIPDRLKLNMKLGRANHKVRETGVKKHTMVVGADVTHPSKMPDLQRCATTPSLAGVVGTVDHEYVHYLPSARLQEGKTEVCTFKSKPD